MRCSDAGGEVHEGADPARRGTADRRSRRRRRLHATDRRAVGSGNNSAVLYHFGSKDKLVQAIFEYRLPRLRERRQLIAEREPRTCAGGSSARSARCSSRASSTTALHEFRRVALPARRGSVQALCRGGSDRRASSRITCAAASAHRRTAAQPPTRSGHGRSSCKRRAPRASASAATAGAPLRAGARQPRRLHGRVPGGAACRPHRVAALEAMNPRAFHRTLSSE